MGDRFQDIRQTVDGLERPLLDRTDVAARVRDRTEHEERQTTEDHAEVGSPSSHG